MAASVLLLFGQSGRSDAADRFADTEVPYVFAASQVEQGPDIGFGPQPPVPEDLAAPPDETSPDSGVPTRLDRLEAELEELRGQVASRPALTPDQEELPSEQFPTLQWSGFLQVDSGWFIQDAASLASVGNVQDRTGLRRVRLRAFGHVRRETTYVVDLDFAASGHPSFRDVMLRGHEVPLLQNVRFGYFQQPFSMDAMTSGQELVFMERWLPFAFAPFRATGVGADGTMPAERGTWAVSAYRFPTDQYGRSIGDRGGYAVATRVTCLPWYRNRGRQLIHLGFSYSFGDPGDNLVQYQIQPGFFVTESGGSAEGDDDPGVPAFVDTGEIPTQSFNLFNAELAVNLGPLHAQSEVSIAVVDQIGGPTLLFSGAYAQLGLYLTGESRPYVTRKGVFSSPPPIREANRGRHGIGAWEIAAGWSYVDLNDRNIRGGELNGYILGLNWYLNPLAKMQLNYTHAFLSDPAGLASETEIIALRAQFKF